MYCHCGTSEVVSEVITKQLAILQPFYYKREIKTGVLELGVLKYSGAVHLLMQ